MSKRHAGGRLLVCLLLLSISSDGGRSGADDPSAPDEAAQAALRARAYEAVAAGNRRLAIGSAQEAARAAASFTEALTDFQHLGDQAAEAETLYALGLAYTQADQREQARQAYREALTRYRNRDDPRGAGAVRNNLGLLDAQDGKLATALDHLDAALLLRQQAGDERGEASTLHNLGAVHHDLGEAQVALDAYRQAAALHRAAGDRVGEAATANNVGLLEAALGRYDEALAHYEHALALHRAVGDRTSAAGTHNNIALVHLQRGDLDRALYGFAAALPGFQATGDQRGAGAVRNNMGLAHLQAGRLEAAQTHLAAALPLRQQSGDRRGEAATMGNLGAVALARGDLEKAQTLLRRALTLQRRIGTPWDQSETLLRLAHTAQQRGDLDNALARIEEALTLVGSLRAQLLRRDLRATYLASQRDLHDFRVALLMARHRARPTGGDAARALRAAEASRARSLAEQLAAARAGLRQDLDPAPAKALRRLRREIVGAEHRRLRWRAAGEETAAQDLAATIARQLEAYRTQEAALGAQHPRYATLAAPPTLGPAEIQPYLDGNTVLLAYHLGQEQSHLWMVSATATTAFDLSPRAEIEDAARRLHTLLSRSHERAFAAPALVAARRLAALVLTPVASRLTGRRLVVVPDGALAYIPFAALPLSDHDTPLGIEQEVVHLPAASLLPLLRRPSAPAPRTLAVLADPVFTADDPRVDRAAAGSLDPPAGDSWQNRLPRLPFSRREASTIADLAPAGTTLTALDFAASRRLVLSDTLADYRFIHFATHGLLDTAQPELSGLALSMVDNAGQPQDGVLRLLDIYQLQLRAELVVLSACRTALGREIRSEGLDGLARGFLHAGAPRVVVSLWDVNDEATAAFMEHFYRGLLAEKRRPADALRAARQAVRANPRWRAPYYWASFVLLGDWAAR